MNRKKVRRRLRRAEVLLEAAERLLDPDAGADATELIVQAKGAARLAREDLRRLRKKLRAGRKAREKAA